MSTNLDTARARLRAADPADPVDPHDAAARAMFERIVTDPAEPARVRTRSPRRRLVLAGAAVAAVAAVATAGAITTPWSHGHPADGAFAVTPKADGSIAITVRWNQLRDPAALNAKLARLHARTVVMQVDPSCKATPVVDPAHNGLYRIDLTKHPELGNPGAEAAWLRAQQPWISYGATNVAFTLHPRQIPAGDTLVIPYDLRADVLPNSPVSPISHMLVREVPSCVTRLVGVLVAVSGSHTH